MHTPENIKKRSGKIEKFEIKKISEALQKAFMATQGGIHESKLSELTENILRNMNLLFPTSTPAVEDVQNMVEKTLMTEGFYEVAKKYIIYRYEHSKERKKQEERVVEKIEQSDLSVIKASGEKQMFSKEKLRKTLLYAAKGFEDEIDIETILHQCEKNLQDNISTKDARTALIMATRGFIERNPNYSFITARLLKGALYKEVIGPTLNYNNFETQYQETFVRNIKTGVEIGRLDPRLLDFDLESLSKKIKPERDDLFKYLGLQTLYDRYFVRNPKTKKILETPQIFWMRIAMGLSVNESDKLSRTEEFYNTISKLKFIPSTPTLFHSGTHKPQLSSCYITTVDDSLDHIFKSLSDNAQLSKWSGGIGNDWTNLRGTGALIKGTGVESQGVVPFLKIANDVTVSINRSGRRRGATCAYLEVWHYDIEDFLELRKNTGDERRRTHDMNTAAWIPDLFMKRVENDEDWILFSPDETPDLHHIYGKKFEEQYKEYERQAAEGKLKLHKKIKAKTLWKKMITMLFETGHPWITFKDPCNVRSPQDHVGVIHSSNLCTEITLNTSPEETAVCNLGSINLPLHIKNEKLDYEEIEKTTSIAIRMLDNVIDINFYPTIEGKNSNQKHRPIGLGVMGLQDVLYKLEKNFDSDEAVKIGDEIFENISYNAILASSKLAKERGTYKSYKGSKWDRGIFPLDTMTILEEERGQTIPVDKNSTLNWDKLKEHVAEHGMRNSNCLAIAPTATISNIAGSFPCIEPTYKNIYVKSNMSGEFTIINPYLVEELQKENLWNQEMLEEIKRHNGNIQNIDTIPRKLRNIFKETFDVEPEWFIRHAAYRGKWIDQSQALNIFIKGTSGKKISETYQYAWKMGLKTTYYLRSLGASDIEMSTLALNKQNTLEDTKKKTESKISMSTNEEPKLCKIEDPECESCQ